MIRLTSYGGKQRGPEETLHEGKEESEKAGLKVNIQKMKITVSSPITTSQIGGKQWKQGQNLFLGPPKSMQMVTAAMELKKMLAACKKSYDQSR